MRPPTRLEVRLVLAALAGSAASLAGLGLIGSAAWLITRAAGQPPLSALSLAIVSVRAFATLRGVFRYGERLAGHDAALRAQTATRARLYTALVPVRRTDGSRSRRDGDLLSRLVNDTEAVQDLLVRCLLPAVTALVTAAAAFLLGLHLAPPAAAVLVCGLSLAGAVLPAVTAAAARRTSVRISPARAELAALTADLIHGAADLAAHGAGDRARAAAAAADARLAALERNRARLNAAAAAAGMLLQGLTVLGVVLTARAAGADDIATAVLALTALVAFEPVLPLAAAGERLTGALASLRRLREVSGAPGAAEPAKGSALPRGPLTVRVEGLTVRYGPDREPALSGVDLTLGPGRCTALVGPSGSGKSTVLAALMRSVEVESGSIFLESPSSPGDQESAGMNNSQSVAPPHRADMQDLSGESVREAITGLLQEPYVFRASLRDNLRLARPGATDAELAAAARRAGLGPWAERTGWSTLLGEDGRSVSGGQLQRIAITRALLRDPRILLLDEPAESLDEASAAALMNTLLDVADGRTTLMATHRLRGLERADEIIVLEGGRVTQRGTHAELLAASGYYRDAWLSESLAVTAADQFA